MTGPHRRWPAIPLPRIRSSDRRPGGDIFGDNSAAGSDPVLADRRAHAARLRTSHLLTQRRCWQCAFGDNGHADPAVGLAFETAPVRQAVSRSCVRAPIQRHRYGVHFGAMSPETPELSMQSLAVIRELIRDPGEPRYGLELSDAARLKAGTVYAILARLERYGWLESFPEQVDPTKVGRPARRLYQLTAAGAPAMRAAFSSAVASLFDPPLERGPQSTARPRADTA
jgi:PadR family transcriptional regulator PadR